MNNDITQIAIIAFAIVPFVNAIIGLIKQTIPNLKGNYVPAIAFGTGIILGLLFAFLPNVNYSLGIMLMAGGVAGLTSVGVYEIANLPKKGDGKSE
jgi:uncharacterized membrane protein